MTVPDPNAPVSRAEFDALVKRVKTLEDSLRGIMDGFSEVAKTKTHWECEWCHQDIPVTFDRCPFCG